MSRLEELINKLCPNGVVFKQISTVAIVSIGEFVHKSKQSDSAEYPVYNGGVANTGFYTDYNRTENKIIISARGANAGYVNRVFTKFWSGNSCYTIDVDNKILNWNFAYYWLKHNETQLLGKQQKAGIPAVSKKQVEDFLIPLPPLPVQEEIVRILDNMTLLTTELNEKLAEEKVARQKRYEYYRDSLLSFEGKGEQDGVRWINLGEVTHYSKDRILASGVDSETYVGVDNLLPNKQGKKISVCVPESGTLIRFDEGDILIGNIRPYLKKIWLADCIGGTNGDVLTIQINEGTNIISKYLYYLLSSDDFFEYNMQHAKGAKMPRGSKDAVMNYEIPIPSLEEQQRIVDILDRFDKLCNDISEGLPSEIEARKKQYEYYRDKLLAFKEKEA